MSLTVKKVNYIFEESLSLNKIVDLFFLLRGEFKNSRRNESQAEKTSYLIWTVDWGGERNIHRHTE